MTDPLVITGDPTDPFDEDEKARRLRAAILSETEAALRPLEEAAPARRAALGGLQRRGVGGGTEGRAPPTNPRAANDRLPPEDDVYEPMSARESSPGVPMDTGEPTPMRGDLGRSTSMEAARDTAPSELDLAQQEAEERRGGAGGFFNKLGAALLAYAGQHGAAEAKRRRHAREAQQPIRDYMRQHAQQMAQERHGLQQQLGETQLQQAHTQQEQAASRADPSSPLNTNFRELFAQQHPSLAQGLQERGMWDELTVDDPAMQFLQQKGVARDELEQAARERAAKMEGQKELIDYRTEAQIRRDEETHERKMQRAAAGSGSLAAMRATGGAEAGGEGAPRFASAQQAAESVQLEQLKADDVNARYPDLYSTIEDAQQRLDEGRYQTRSQQQRLQSTIEDARKELQSRESSRQKRHGKLRGQHQKIGQQYFKVQKSLEKDYGLLQRVTTEWEKLVEEHPMAAEYAIKAPELSRGELEDLGISPEATRKARRLIGQSRTINYVEYAGLRTSPQEKQRVESGFGVYRLDRPEDFTSSLQSALEGFQQMREDAKQAYQPGWLWREHDSLDPRFMGAGDLARVTITKPDGTIMAEREALNKQDANTVVRRFRELQRRTEEEYGIQVDFQ